MSFLFQVPSFKIRVCAISGRDLAAKDRNGLSDPFLKFKLGEQKHSTHVCLETLSPTWDDKFDLVLPVSKPPTHLVIVCWDKDRFGRDFMGEIKIPIADLFMRNGRPRLFENNGPQWYKLETRGKEVVSGEIQLHWGFKCNKRDLQRHLDWCLLL
ncbi:C2 domain-containing protein, partial [Syncephalis plumigaleata]